MEYIIIIEFKENNYFVWKHKYFKSAPLQMPLGLGFLLLCTCTIQGKIILFKVPFVHFDKN